MPTTTTGVGALYACAGTPIRSLLVGADQEHGLRPDTENVPATVASGLRRGARASACMMRRHGRVQGVRRARIAGESVGMMTTDDEIDRAAGHVAARRGLADRREMSTRRFGDAMLLHLLP
ncbi:hypothetical protein [Stutzerimonas stutzeri]|uniref:hypothetical protein n=1 Tax=Stutzerimonas stutzeri TaxID=316 RepID=UPI00222E81D0|nr:hypothetical protein [Stutzerimonas stutzeri]